MEFKELIQLIKDAGYEPYPYSGRGMYGHRCVGLTCHKIQEAIADLFETCMNQDMDEFVKSVNQVMQEHQELCQIIKDSQYDNLGFSEVLYFPTVSWNLIFTTF